VGKHMAAARSIDVQFDPPTANRTLGVQRVKSPPGYELDAQ